MACFDFWREICHPAFSDFSPNFEAPTDTGGNNVYDVTVQVSDGHGSIDSQAIAVAVTDQNEAPAMPANLIVGNDGSNSLQGIAGADVIYGYNPDGPQSDASTIAATRVASGLNQPVFTGAPAGDPGRLFIVERTGLIKVLDLNTGQVLATPFLDVSSQILRKSAGCSASRSIRITPATACSTSI